MMLFICQSSRQILCSPIQNYGQYRPPFTELHHNAAALSDVHELSNAIVNEMADDEEMKGILIAGVRRKGKRRILPPRFRPTN